MQCTQRRLQLGLAAGLTAVVSLLFAALTPDVARAAGIWEGQVAEDTINVRAAPSTSAPIVGSLDQSAPVGVAEWVIGEKVVGSNDLWGRVADGGYVYSGVLTKAAPTTPPAPPPAPTTGRWIDVNLTQQVATAYEGTRPVYTALVSTGTPGWETPVGTFPVARRVANETMDSSSLAVSVAQGYRLPNVRWTQYLTEWGHAIHANYWKWDSPFGVPTSHGCIGMTESDAAFFWNFATTGTPVVIHF